MPSLIPNFLASGQTKIIETLVPAHVVAFDALITDATDLSVTVTDHPIEDGADVSDHIRDDPDQLRLDIVVSQTPANIPDLVTTTASLDFFRQEEAWQRLVDLLKRHAFVRVVTSVATWDDMVIQSLSRSRSSTVGQALEATIKVNKVVKVKSSTALAPSRAANVQNPQNATGKVTTTPAKDQSAGAAVFDGAKAVAKHFFGGG
jgi:DNA polymerase III gamma/tau subunit